MKKLDKDIQIYDNAPVEIGKRRSSAMTRQCIRCWIGVLALTTAGWTGRAAAGDIESEPINYAKAPADNVISRLQQRIESGRTTLKYEPHFGRLRSLLGELQVPESSQTLVFSKTSLQRHRITPTRPRSLYFNDDVFIGFCQRGDVLEVTAVDPKLGAVFYTLDQKQPDKPRFTRHNDTCTICHASSANQGLPGNLVRSVYPDQDGLPILSMGSHRIDQTTPLAERWGGWYVTGTSGKQTHLGNCTLKEHQEPERVDNSRNINLNSLEGRIKTADFLTPHSDIVALMVLEHQAEMLNLLTRANLLTRMALYDEASINKALDRPLDYRSETTISRIKSAGEPLVKYMLFSREAKLTEPIKGTSSFAEEFSRKGPRDKQGRSLRSLDLQNRLFTYPCSYLIYSTAFDALPAEMKEYVYGRLWSVLNDKDTGDEFAHLSAADRQAILEILRATKSDLPKKWAAR
jgi:hypothetical protein